jgi:ribosome-interacting GTPase 1
MMDYEGVKAQIVDLPSYGGKEFDVGLVHGSDLVLVVIEKYDDFEYFSKSEMLKKKKCVYVYSKCDLLNGNERRKLEARLKSKKVNFVFVSINDNVSLNNLMDKIFLSMGVIRVFTKEPGKEANKDPVVLEEGSNVLDVAETIYKGFSKTVTEVRLTGPSGKFANQRVGMNHVLKDRDVVEFKSR